MNSQVHSMDEPRQVEILSVDFDAKEPDIKVVWKNMTYSKTGGNYVYDKSKYSVQSEGNINKLCF